MQVRADKARFTGPWTNLVILVGENDLGYHHVEDVMTDLHTLIALLQFMNLTASVDVCEVLPRKNWTRDDVPTTLHPNVHAQEFNRVLNEEFPGRVVELYQYFVGRNGQVLSKLYKEDGLHPDKNGGRFLKGLIRRHVKCRDEPEYYETFYSPRFYQPGVSDNRAVDTNPPDTLNEQEPKCVNVSES